MQNGDQPKEHWLSKNISKLAERRDVWKKTRPYFYWPILGILILVGIALHHFFENWLNTLSWGWIMRGIIYALWILVALVFFALDKNRCGKNQTPMSWEPWMLILGFACLFLFREFHPAVKILTVTNTVTNVVYMPVTNYLTITDVVQQSTPAVNPISISGSNTQSPIVQGNQASNITVNPDYSRKQTGSGDIIDISAPNNSGSVIGKQINNLGNVPRILSESQKKCIADSIRELEVTNSELGIFGYNLSPDSMAYAKQFCDTLSKLKPGSSNGIIQFPPETYGKILIMVSDPNRPPPLAMAISYGLDCANIPFVFVPPNVDYMMESKGDPSYILMIIAPAF